MSNFNRSPLLSLKSPIVAPNPHRGSQYTEVDISEYFDESVGEHDFLPSVPASPLRALFSTTVTSNNVAPPARAATRSASPNKNLFLHQKKADLALVPGPQLASPPRPPRIPRSNAADAPRMAISSIPSARSRPVSVVNTSPSPSRQYLLIQPTTAMSTEPGTHIPSSMQPDLEKVLRKPTYLGKPAGSSSSPPPTVILPSSDEYFNRKDAAEMVRKSRRVRNARRIIMVFIVVFAVVLGIAAGVIAVILNKKASSSMKSSNDDLPLSSSSEKKTTTTTTTTVEGGTNLSRRDFFKFDTPSNGEGTFYNTGLGACGETSNDEQLVCALNHIQFGTFPNPANSPFCGVCLEVTGPLGSVQVTVVDKCPGCKHGDLDLSPAAFKKIANLDDGRVGITWKPCSTQRPGVIENLGVAAKGLIEAISSASEKHF